MLEITPPRCSCGGAARQKVFNTRNGHVGDFCNRCAKRKVEELNEKERGGDADQRERRG